MEQGVFDRDRLIRHWIDSSDDDYETMITLLESRRYSWALFAGHLLTEKLLKALYAGTRNDYPPPVHNLLRLAEGYGLEMSEENKVFLITVTAFNINARYDDYKKSFHKKCTSEFTTVWIEKIKQHRQWIKKLIGPSGSSS
jgi:HEPN domain-containing protein